MNVKINHERGPYKFQGSNRFYNVYRQNKYQKFARIFYLPDSTEKTLINDFQNYVDMSTFLENGNILLKIKERYMVFTQRGKFIDEVEFDDPVNENIDEDVITLKDFNNAVHRNCSDGDKKTNERKPVIDQTHEKFKDFDGNPYIQNAAVMDKNEINEDNKMELLNFSYNNRFFLFFDKKQIKLKLFELCVVVDSDMNPDAYYQDEIPSPEADAQEYEFILKYELIVGESHLFSYLYERGIDVLAYF